MSFVALPSIPTSGLSDAEFQLLAAISQNLGLLTGQSLAGYKAVTSGQLTLSSAPAGNAQSVSITGTANDLANIAISLQTLINDVQSLRDTVNILIAQLRS